MRFPGRRRVVAGGRWLRSRFRGRALILGYHRLDQPTSDPYRLSVSPSTFRAHVEAIKRHARGIRLADLVRGVRDGSVPSGVVALTVDDAYAETVGVLQTVLEEYELSAALFVPTAYLGREPWWEKLRRVLTGFARLPPRLEVHRDGVNLSRDLHEAERSPGAPVARDELVLEVYDALRRLPKSTRDSVLVEIEAWAGGDPEANRDRMARVASTDRIVDLASHELIEIGAHSVSHPFLGSLPASEQMAEIRGSREMLEELVGGNVDLFSYPNGSWNERTPALVAEAGYVGACASHPDVVGGWSNPYALARMWPADDPDEVERMLRVWLA